MSYQGTVTCTSWTYVLPVLSHAICGQGSFRSALDSAQSDLRATLTADYIYCITQFYILVDTVALREDFVDVHYDLELPCPLVAHNQTM